MVNCPTIKGHIGAQDFLRTGCGGKRADGAPRWGGGQSL